MHICQLLLALLAGFAMLLTGGAAQAARVSNIAATKHNLSTSGTGSLKATTETQICVFCHTPHGATIDGKAPLWNRKLSTDTYTPYTSSSLDAKTIQVTLEQPGGSSKLCLSCHDGTMAIGQVNVLGGQGSATIQGTRPIAMTGTSTSTVTGAMAIGSGPTTGFTRNLGTELGNDHPISVTYNIALVDADGEMRAVDAAQSTVANSASLPLGKPLTVGIRDFAANTRPLLALEKTGASNAGQVQCATCHDPHIRDASETVSIKFLRANRFQKNAGPTGGVFNYSNDIICLGCHDKAGTVWSQSAHAVSTTTQAYNNTAANLREFAIGTEVWQAACLNCHDTHTVQGARRLLREGTVKTDNTVDTAIPRTGGNPAIEQTCYQCHQLRTNTATSTPPMVLNLATQTVPDIMTDFTALGSYHMPITSAEQCAGSEKHSIGDTVTDGNAVALNGKDFVERPALLGAGGGNDCNRHVECTDCHNPHRVKKGNHVVNPELLDIRGTLNGNNVSNALLGGFGVEPVYPSDTTFGRIPTSFSLRCGSGSGSSNCTQVLTKEYQICLKCHSNYAYTDVDDPVGDAATGYVTNSRPTIGGMGTTPADLPAFLGKNGVNVWPANSKYTNQAMEFWGPDSHKGEATAGAPSPSHGFTGAYASPNHRSWHPVMTVTGRTSTERGGADNWKSPWQTNLGNQTMYCTDCHGNTTTNTDNTPNTNKAWGPHGSTSPFILKGTYDKDSRVGDSATTVLCLKCHTPNSGTSGFCCDGRGNLHAYHASKMNGGSNGRAHCTYCHIAVPHGWKHKALLADTRTVGNEVGLTTETDVSFTNTQGYTKGPYYLNAMLKVTTWKQSGSWAKGNCNGGVNGMKSACQNQ